MNDLVAAVAWLWLGMVVAISFLEAPLKFRVLDLRSGLAVGRLVFQALNGVEAVLAVLVVVGVAGSHTPARVAAAAVAVLALVAQLVGVRPALTRRSDQVLAGEAGEDGPRSRAHLWYVGIELVKVAALVVLGLVALGA